MAHTHRHYSHTAQNCTVSSLVLALCVLWIQSFVAYSTVVTQIIDNVRNQPFTIFMSRQKLFSRCLSSKNSFEFVCQQQPCHPHQTKIKFCCKSKLNYFHPDRIICKTSCFNIDGRGEKECG